MEWLAKRKIKLKKVDKTNFYQELKKVKSIEEIDILYKEMGKEIFTLKTLLETEEVEGAVNSIKKLSKQYDIYIITARTNTLILQVKKWLEKNKIEKNIKKILSSSYEAKQDICCRNNIQFLCDDDIRHLEKDIIKKRVLFNPADRQKNSEIFEVNSWREIEKILLKVETDFF